MPKDTPLFIDNSTLAALAACDTRALLRYHHGLTTDSEGLALQAGSAVHAGLEAFFRTSDRKTALKAYRAYYEEWANEHVPAAPQKEQMWMLAYSFDNVRDILKTWMRRHPLEGEPYVVDPERVEIGFNYPLTPEGDIVFYGRYDAIVEERATGHLYVLDHKTTGQLTAAWASSFKLSTQMTGYVWAAQQALDKPVTGAIINGIEIRKLPDVRVTKDGAPYKCKEHGIGIDECRLTHVKDTLAITQREEWQIELWKRNALVLAKRFRALVKEYPELADLHGARQQGAFSGSCRYCDFKSFCEVGRPTDRVESMLLHRPWKPYETEVKSNA